MATYTLKLWLSNGGVINFHMASSVAVGTLLPVEVNNTVSATLSPSTFRVKEPVRILDVTTDQTAGQVRFVADNVETNKFIDTNAMFAATNNARPLAAIRQWKLVPGRNYSLKVTVAGAA